MILQGSKNKIRGKERIRLGKEPYLFINLFFAAAITLIFIYSLVFSPAGNNYPVACIHEKITGKPCASCGLSHGFSLIVRGEFKEAFRWNIYSMRIFIFFASQFLMRVIFSVLYMKYPSDRQSIMISDMAGSGLLFLIAFWPFMRWMIAVLSSGG